MFAHEFRPGDLVKARGREWVVLPEPREKLLKLRPFGGAEEDATLIYLPLEPNAPTQATFSPPDSDKPGSLAAALLLRDALRLKLRAGAGPFRSFGNLNVDPRAYQLVPLLLALKLDTVRLLIADDVGIGKTIEAGLIARELLDRGEIQRLAVICPPHLCEQWKKELAEKFAIDAEVVRTGTATRLERGLRPDESLFEAHRFTIVSLDYIKSDRRRDDFLRTCPECVIVDEAHTCVQSNTSTRHQRYLLVKGLAENKRDRHMVLLTATPHSGNDTAFHNLLGLLDPEFQNLAHLPKGEERERLRARLARHFVQRRRGDIDEWMDSSKFPQRESREATYRLTGKWGALFEDVLGYARAIVRRTEGGTKVEQRMSWWAALALLRCLSSSPAAASLALRTRLEASEGKSERDRVSSLDLAAANSVLDGGGDDSLTPSDSVPAGVIETPEDAAALRKLIDRADELRGPGSDPKLKVLIREIRSLVKAGFRPVVFCRFIATARYVGDQLTKALRKVDARVDVVTGELTPDQREERVSAFGDLGDTVPVLVATDCLSEGINLQDHFNAIVHYDLTWNPTRHEQREGRADRFGQSAKVVRALMLYGGNNPVDGALLRVIHRKAEKIRKELGVLVPLPKDNNGVVEAVMKTVLSEGGSYLRGTQRNLELEEIEVDVDAAWETARTRIRASRTLFAQRSLSPRDVIPEWKKARSVLGNSDDVARFVRLGAERLGAPLHADRDCFRFPIPHLPKPLQERLADIGFKKTVGISFKQPAPTGSAHIHRAHPLVAALADYVAEETLDSDSADLGARAGAMFTDGVETRTVLHLLRLRCHLQIERRGPGGRFAPERSLVAEECFSVASRGSSSARAVTEDEALKLFKLTPTRNMPKGQQSHFLRQALFSQVRLNQDFEVAAKKKAEQLLGDHRRIREASRARGLRYKVAPILPVDQIGVFVFVPAIS